MILNIIFQFETSNIELHISYKVCYAQMMNFRLKFIEAAQEFHKLSTCSSLKDSECMTALKNTLVCTILSFASKIQNIILIESSTSVIKHFLLKII